METRVAIISYGMGNIASLANAFRAIGVDPIVAESPEMLEAATHIVLPGVGAFPRGMESLEARGFVAYLKRRVPEGSCQLLGVCLGMQLLADEGEEHRLTPGLGFFPGRVTRLEAPGLRVPHVGWNDTVSRSDDSLIGERGTNDCFYYVHSFRFVADREEDVSLTCEYGREFVAGATRGNIHGVQFHPEKSHAGGLSLLKSFMEKDAVLAGA